MHFLVGWVIRDFAIATGLGIAGPSFATFEIDRVVVIGLVPDI